MRGLLDKPEKRFSAFITFSERGMLMLTCRGLDLSTCRQVVRQAIPISLVAQAVITLLHGDWSPNRLPCAADPVRLQRQRAPCRVQVVIRRDFMSGVKQNSQSMPRIADDKDYGMQLQRHV
jgi:hypothetical protein